MPRIGYREREREREKERESEREKGKKTVAAKLLSVFKSIHISYRYKQSRSKFKTTEEFVYMLYKDEIQKI